MRYEDASHTGAFVQGSEPDARNDADAIAAGAHGPATGNVITGEGTQTGPSGADYAAGAHITSIAGAGGEDSSFAGGKLAVSGEFGRLSIDAEGNYSYVAKAGTPENSRDRFTYTLADSQGNADTATLTVEIGKTPAVIKANAQQVVPGPDGVVILPPGVELSDVHVVGRNLVIDLPDGSQMVIIDGAVFVPQLVLGGVEVPATNLAALLVGQEIAPAAGEGPPQSSGGNFDVPVPPLDPGVPLGDLIPPTEYTYVPPEVRDVFDLLDEEPEAGATFAQLDDDAQEDGNPGGVGDDPGGSSASGFLPGSGGDGDLTWDLQPTGDLPAGFTFADQPNGDVWVLQGGEHVLTITLVDPATGEYRVDQVQAIDHPAGGNENNLSFTINYTVTDEDGDTATGSLTFDVDDDTPIAVTEGQVTGLVDEDDLPSGNNDNADGDDDPGNADGDNDGTTTAGAAGSLSGLFSFGADQPGTSGLGTNTSGMTAQGLTSNGVALTYAVVGNTLTASAGGSTVFTLTVNADGSWTFDLEGQLDHPIANTEDNLDIDFSSMIVGTDHDGDTASLPDDTFVITVDDDLPVPAGERARVTGLVDEDDLPSGNHDNADGDDDPGDADGDGDGTTTGGDAGSLSGLFSFGADQPGTVELSSDTSGLPALTSNGATVTYSVQGNVLTASAGGSTVFTLTVNPDGSWVFDLQGQLDHSIAGTEDNLDLDFSSIIIGVDADGDTATLPPNSFVVDVDDDMPQEFEDCPEDVITVNEPGSTFTGDLNLPPVGADDPGVVSFGVSDGDPVLDNGDNPVTANGQALFYFINDDGVLEARVGDETGDVIFTITLNGDGTYTYEQVGSLGEGGQIDFEDLTSASAGNVEFRGVGADDPATTVDLLLSGEAGGADATVNTDSDSIGTANQSMDNGETVRIDLVSDLTTGAATPSGFGYSGHVSSNSFIQLIPQVQGAQTETTAFTVWALNTSNTQATEPDRNPSGGFSDSTITSVTEVTVKDYLSGNSTTADVTGFTVGVFTPVAYGISVRVNADGSVTFSGIQEGDSYGINTGAGEFNAVAVQAEPAGTGGSTQDSFDLGIFSIGVANEFEPVDLQVPIVLTDADGDPVVCDIDIHIGAPLEVDDITVTVNEAGLPLIGSDAASNSETQGGDLQGQVSGGTGPYTFAFASGEDGNGSFGTLTLNPDGTFSYTLETPFDSQPDADDGTNPELGAESFQVVATDSLGATQTLTINVNIIDDVPTAVDDTDSIAAGLYGPVDGNVITDASPGDAGDGDNGADTKGADGAAVVGVAAGDTSTDLDNPATVGVVIQGTYGKLTLNADGSYSYTRDAGTDGGVQDVFTYTIEDGDGDRSNATLTITIADSPPTVDAPDQGEAGTVVDEKGLPTRGESPGSGEIADGNGTNNSDTSETTAGVINFTAPDGPAIVRIDGVVVTGVVGQTFAGAHGTLTITSYNAGTGQIGYSYTLADNTSGNSTFDDFAIQVEDQDGDLANDTLVINIIDDVPTARDDVDSVVGGFDPATGNVLTGSEVAVGEDANGTDGVADTAGADGGRVTNIDHAASPAEAVPNGGSTDIQGTYGVLTIYSNGDYSYQRDPGTPGGVEDVFTYTLTDGDGDTDTATLTIGIDDNFPTLPDPDLILLDDDVIPGKGGNDPDGPGDDNPDGIGNNVVNGQLSGSGGDGALTYNFTGDDTLPTGFTIGAGSDADTLLIVQDQNGSPVTVMTIQLDQSDGSFTVTQNNPILHPTQNGDVTNDNTENNLDFSIGVEVEDADHDVEPAHITINVDDDTPTINVTKGADAAVILTTDDADTIGIATDSDQTTANFAGVFGLAQSAGADGTNTAATLSYALDVTGYAGGPAGIDSGLDAHGSTIYLYEIGGKVVGSTSATLAGVVAGNTVFDVSVNGSGQVTLTQYSQIDHPIGSDPTATGGPLYADHIVSMVDSLVTLTASASLTDKDGDTVTDSETVNIGANLHFTDDGPDAATNGQAVGTVTLDETRPEGSDTPGGTTPNGDASATINFALNFVTGGAVDFGADGAGSVGYALQLTGTNVASGLYALDGADTSASDGDGYGQGSQIVLNQSGNVITGSVGATVYFTLTIDPATGIVTFAQVNNIWHPTAGTSSFDESATLNTVTANLIQVIQTVTDFDGDTDTASVDIGRGVFIIQDSGPTTFDPEAIGEGELFNEAGSTATADLDVDANINNNVGTDTPGLVQFANITNGDDSGLTSSDDPIFYYLANNGQTLLAKVGANPDGTGGTLIFTVQLNQGAGTYTVTMAGEIDNGAGVTFDNLTSSKAGNVDVRGVGADDPDTAVDLLLTASGVGGVNTTINTDADSIGSANQSMDQGETVRIDFVTNLEDDPTDNLATFPSGFSYDGHVGTNSYIQAIPQVQGSQTETVAFRVYALDTTVTDAGSPDDTPGDGFSDSDIVTITKVTVDGYNDGPDDGTPNEPAVTVNIGAVGVWTEIAYGVYAQLQTDGSVIFTGIQEGDQYGIETGTDFNAVAVTSLPAGVGPVGHVSSTNSFDLGVFSIGHIDTGDPINIAFDLKLTDADGDTITVTDALQIQIDPAASNTLAATTLAASSASTGEDTSSFSLLASDSQEQQLQKTAANSNTTLLAAAVAASGLAGAQAAVAAPGNSDFGHQASLDASSVGSKFAGLAADSGDASRSALSNEVMVAANDDVSPASSNHGNAASAQSAHGLDNAAAHLPAELSAFFAGADQGPAVNAAAAGPVAPAVAMVSAEALQAAGLDGNAQHGGSVEKVLAEALGNHGAPPTVDALLQALGGHGDAGLAAISHVASPAADAVPAWDTGSAGAFVPGADMMFKMGAEMLHHDAVQPVVNG